MEKCLLIEIWYNTIDIPKNIMYGGVSFFLIILFMVLYILLLNIETYEFC